MNYHIEEQNDDNTSLWEEFNQNRDEGTFFHTLKWKKILESTGYTPHYYLILDDNEPVALCPFFETKIKTFKGITTLPLSDYNHIIIKDNHAVNFIKKELIKIAKRNSWAFILINSLDKDFKNNFNDCLSYPSSGNMIIDMNKLTTDKVWNQVFNSKKKQRRHINRFNENGFHSRKLESLEDLETFYKYYSKNIEHIQGIKFPYSHFKKLYDLYYPENMEINLLHSQDCIAGGTLVFMDDSILYSRYLAFNRRIPNKFHVTYKLIWDLIKKADKIGYKKLCLGTTDNNKNNPNYKIKKNMGANYENIYSVLIPTSRLFKLSYNTYTSFRRI